MVMRQTGTSESLGPLRCLPSLPWGPAGIPQGVGGASAGWTEHRPLAPGWPISARSVLRLRGPEELVSGPVAPPPPPGMDSPPPTRHEGATTVSTGRASSQTGHRDSALLPPVLGDTPGHSIPLLVKPESLLVSSLHCCKIKQLAYYWPSHATKDLGHLSPEPASALIQIQPLPRLHMSHVCSHRRSDSVHSTILPRALSHSGRGSAAYPTCTPVATRLPLSAQTLCLLALEQHPKPQEPRLVTAGGTDSCLMGRRPAGPRRGWSRGEDGTGKREPPCALPRPWPCSLSSISQGPTRRQT